MRKIKQRITVFPKSKPLVARFTFIVISLNILIIDHTYCQNLLFHEDYDWEPISDTQTFEAGDTLVNASEIDSASTVSIIKTDTIKKELTEMEKNAFRLGNDGYDGFRTANIDKQGRLIIIEDHVANELIIRLQKIHSGVLQIQLYAKDGSLAFQREKKNTFVGTEIPIPGEVIPAGFSTLVVNADASTTFKKKLFKQSSVASN